LVLSPFLEDRLDVSLLPVTWEQFQSEWHPKNHYKWLSNLLIKEKQGEIKITLSSQ
jgi:hypothetical protein